MTKQEEVTPSGEQHDLDILDDPRVDKEIRRWQDAIRDKLIDLGAPDWKIDGAGCDSGDPLDFTLAEVGQGAGYFVDKLDALREVVRNAVAQLETATKVGNLSAYSIMHNVKAQLSAALVDGPQETK
jgi:hypothetical protein